MISRLPPPVESTEADAEAPASLKAPGKKAWSKPTIQTSDGVLSAETATGTDPMENVHYVAASS